MSMGGLMRASFALAAFCVGGALGDSTGIDSNNILLCTDTVAGDGTKLVYAYLDSARTACMPEIELRQLLCRRAFESDSAFRRAQSDEVMGNDILASIQKGKREFEGADLSHRDLMGVDLANADLREADFTGSDLRDANLSGADLRGATIRAAFLMRTDLRSARLDNCKLTGSFLMKADLRNAQGLTIEMLRGVKSLHKARMDEIMLDEVRSRLPRKVLEEPKDIWKPTEKQMRAAEED